MRRTRSVFIGGFVIAALMTMAQPAAQGRGKGGDSPKPPKPAQVSTHAAPPASTHPAPAAHATPSKPPTKPAANAHAVSTPKHTPTKPPTKPMTVQAHLASQPHLAAKLTTLLPPNTNLQLASTGFRNLGQFVAAVHVSHNLGIPFDQLKARMTGPRPMSLGQAIAQFKPGVNIDRELRRAEEGARVDLMVRVR